MTNAERLAEKDTTFDGVIPKSLWITISNLSDTRELVVFFELNGIKKELFRMKPGHIDDGNIIESHNLSWLFKDGPFEKLGRFLNDEDELSTQVRALQARNEKLRKALKSVRWIYHKMGLPLDKIDLALADEGEE